MGSKPNQPFRPIQRHLHWIIFALVATAYILINLHTMTSHDSPWHEVTIHAHMLVGVLVLLLVLPRLWVRKKHGVPQIEPPLEHWLRLFSRLSHWALYAFLLVQPLLGIITMQVSGQSVGIFGVTIIPSFVSHPNHQLGHEIIHYHALIGTVFYYVIGLHILAALWHHFIRRDNTMKHMLGSSADRAEALD